ncbi:MAG TPA: glycerate kinase [Chloroflexia bacterium]|nr:glycerate kinase [Chloroflexia bacterium]
MLHRDVVLDVLGAALAAVDPYRAVLRALQSTQVGDARRVYVLGAGKAGAAMSRAAEEAFGERIAGGLVLVKDGHGMPGGEQLERIELVEASHPIPDRRGVGATGRLLEIADSAGEDDLVVCLISGGGSALLTAPAKGISLEDVQATTQLLLRAGATINELNAVRKHLSQVAGGLLARRAAPAEVLSLILSDVTGSPLDVIASGPTAPDSTTYANALVVLERYDLAGKVPHAVLDRMRLGAEGTLPETPKPGDTLFERVSNHIVASNVIAVEAAASRAEEMGFDTSIMSTYVEGEAREVGKVLAGIAKEVAAYGRPVRRPGCVLFGGETTVTVRGSGVGGRNTELALSAAIELEGMGPDIVVASLATDGGDGTSPSAGAIADGTAIARATALGHDAQAALASNDSYTFWAALGDAIITGPTGTNVNDVMAVFVF